MIVWMILRYGDETLKSWKPLLNTIFVFEAHRNDQRNEYRQLILCILY